MRTHSIGLFAAVMTAGLLVSEAASAITATARTSVNVRAGASTASRVVDRLYAGERVNVDRCTGFFRWCHVQHPGPDGWVVAAYLRFGVVAPPPQAGTVCFYEHVNYQGARFCVRRGQSNARLSATWNDRISSIRVQGGARVTVCEHWDYRGRCQTITGNRSSLGSFNDLISSYRVR
jgi:uncharacterized protein YgiM (DUF1202 family)